MGSPGKDFYKFHPPRNYRHQKIKRIMFAGYKFVGVLFKVKTLKGHEVEVEEEKMKPILMEFTLKSASSDLRT